MTLVSATVLLILIKDTRRQYLTDKPVPLTCKHRHCYPTPGFSIKVTE